MGKNRTDRDFLMLSGIMAVLYRGAVAQESQFGDAVVTMPLIEQSALKGPTKLAFGRNAAIEL
jgi:hypothetical protein